MGFTIGDYDFDGPFTELHDINDIAAVFVVVCKHGMDFKILDVDMSSKARHAIEHHDRKYKWESKCFGGGLAYAAYYCGSLAETEMAQTVIDIVKVLDPPCYPL